MKVARRMRPSVSSIRRRALVATLHRWYDDAGFEKLAYPMNFRMVCHASNSRDVRVTKAYTRSHTDPGSNNV